MKNYLRAINWMYTAVGSFAFYVGLLAIYRIARPEEGRTVNFPVFGDLSYSATIVFGIPVLTITSLVSVYFCFRHLSSSKAHGVSPCQYFPAPFNQDLISTFPRFRCLFFILFVIFPSLVSAILFFRLLELEIYNLESGFRLMRWHLFLFEKDWWNGAIWRWTSLEKGERLSAYPGFQPLFYVLLIATSGVVILILAANIAMTWRKNRITNSTNGRLKNRQTTGRKR